MTLAFQELLCLYNTAFQPTRTKVNPEQEFLERPSLRHQNFAPLGGKISSPTCSGPERVPLRLAPGFDIVLQLLSDLQRHTAQLFADRMIGQKTINSFFSPVSKKRISRELNETEDDAKELVSLSTHVYFFN